MNLDFETVALKWNAVVRETAEKTISTVLPDLDRSGILRRICW